MKQLMPSYSTARRIDEAAAGLNLLNLYPEYLDYRPIVACTGTFDKWVGPAHVYIYNTCV